MTHKHAQMLKFCCVCFPPLIVINKVLCSAHESIFIESSNETERLYLVWCDSSIFAAVFQQCLHDSKSSGGSRGCVMQRQLTADLQEQHSEILLIRYIMCKYTWLSLPRSFNSSSVCGYVKTRQPSQSQEYQLYKRHGKLYSLRKS